MLPASANSVLSPFSWFSASLLELIQLSYHHQLGLTLFSFLILCIHVYIVYFWLYWVLVAAQAVLYLWQVRAAL